MTEVEEKVSDLEKIIQRIAVLQAKSQESIYALSREINNSIKEMRLYREKVDRQIEEHRKSMEEFKEEMRLYREKVDRQIEERRKSMEEFKKGIEEYKQFIRESIRNLNKMWGDLANRLGTVTEDLIAPNLPNKLMDVFGLDEPDDVIVRIKRYVKEKGLKKEIDLLVVYKEKKLVFVNETKSTTKISYIERFYDFIRSGLFLELFPEYQGYHVIPIFSSLFINDEHINLLTEKNIFAVHVEGDILTIKNLDKLKPNYNFITK